MTSREKRVGGKRTPRPNKVRQVTDRVNYKCSFDGDGTLYRWNDRQDITSRRRGV